MFKKIALILFGIIGLVLTFGSEGAYDSSLSLKNEDRPKVTLSHMSWDDSLASTAVIKNVLEDEGFQVNLVQLDPTFIFSSLATGDSDFSVSPWLPVTHGSYLEEYGEDLDIIGPHMDEAKMAYVLSNDEIVKIGDKVEITEDDNTKTSGNVIDIAETYITLELEEGGEFDAYFSELKDVRVIK